MIVGRLREALRYHPTRRLAVVVVLLAPLWLLSVWRWGIVVAVAALVVVVLAAIADALALPAARDLAVDRELPPTIGVGDSVEGEVRVSGSWDHPVRLRLYDQLPS